MTRCILDLNLKPADVRRYVEENFSVEVMVRKYVELYQETLQNKSGERVA